jgi:hypothetical protein
MRQTFEFTHNIVTKTGEELQLTIFVSGSYSPRTQDDSESLDMEWHIVEARTEDGQFMPYRKQDLEPGHINDIEHAIADMFRYGP